MRRDCACVHVWRAFIQIYKSFARNGEESGIFYESKNTREIQKMSEICFVLNYPCIKKKDTHSIEQGGYF